MNNILNVYATGRIKANEKSDAISLETFVNDIKGKKWEIYYHTYYEIFLHCRSFHRLPRRFFLLLLCRLMAKRSCWLVDEHGRRERVGLKTLIQAFGELITDIIYSNCFLRKCLYHLEVLDSQDYAPVYNKNGIPYYVRNDYVMEFLAGGSIGHIAGIANSLFRMYDSNICFVTSSHIATLNDRIHQHVIDDKDKLKFTNLRDVTSIYYNIPTLKYLRRMGERYKPSFIYHRSALNEYSAIEFAIENNIPLILEYNGSEVWIRNNWSDGKMGAMAVSKRIEQLAFKKAKLIVCVSKPLREQLIGWGIDSDKIVVVPNGVDVEKYNPYIAGDKIRSELHIEEDELVVGFIGTFGLWHGTDVLAQAAVEIISENRKNIRFLFIGDGMMMPTVRNIIDPYNEDRRCIFTGIVPQDKGREYLAACDILVSPTIPNPDGTPFFGSPTKLFEYMAMGKAIVVSDMDQMAEVCENEKTALLIPPGDIKKLKEAILRLSEDKELRIILGSNARKEVCSKYTWEIQTKTIIEEFNKRCNL